MHSVTRAQKKTIRSPLKPCRTRVFLKYTDYFINMNIYLLAYTSRERERETAASHLSEQMKQKRIASRSP